MNNPFPEHGEIKEILHYIEHDYESPMMNEVYGYLSGKPLANIRYAEFPSNYILTIKYKTCQYKYQCFNLTEEQYKEIAQNLFENASFEFEKQGWPISLVWKDFKFRPIEIKQILYNGSPRRVNEKMEELLDKIADIVDNRHDDSFHMTSQTARHLIANYINEYIEDLIKDSKELSEFIKEKNE